MSGVWACQNYRNRPAALFPGRLPRWFALETAIACGNHKKFRQLCNGEGDRIDADNTPHFVYKYKPISLFSVSVLLSRQLLPRFETLEFLQAVSDRFFDWGTQRYPC